jgi:hypothetical protein
MEYTIHKLAQMAGISSRTLRHYDSIGLLRPAGVNASGYRVYTRREGICCSRYCSTASWAWVCRFQGHTAQPGL